MLTLEHIQREANKGNFVMLIAIDLKKAFDTVDVKSVLPKKLEHYKFDSNSNNWITSFFTGRKQYVQINDTKSDTKHLRDISVCQGSCMGPNFFNLYFNDIVHNNEFVTFLFADDTNFLESDKDLYHLSTKANLEINSIQKYLQANKLSLNLTKSNFMVFPPKNANRVDFKVDLKIDNFKLNEVTETKFLGIKIPTDLKFKAHYENVIAKMKSGLAALSLVKDILPSRTKLQIFNALIKSHYEYASIIWSPQLTQFQTQNIVKLQKRGLRLVYSANRMCHSANLFIKSNITRFDLLFKKATIEIFHKKFQGTLPKKVESSLNLLTKSRNPRNLNYRIPPFIKKGDLMYELINTWNNLPNDIKTVPNKFSKSKIQISKFINEQYPLCNLKPCNSCKVTPFENIMNILNEIVIVLK